MVSILFKFYLASNKCFLMWVNFNLTWKNLNYDQVGWVDTSGMHFPSIWLMDFNTFLISVVPPGTVMLSQMDCIITLTSLGHMQPASMILPEGWILFFMVCILSGIWFKLENNWVADPSRQKNRSACPEMALYLLTEDQVEACAEGSDWGQ